MPAPLATNVGEVVQENLAAPRSGASIPSGNWEVEVTQKQAAFEQKFMVGYANEGLGSYEGKVGVSTIVRSDRNWEILIMNDGGKKEWRHSNILQENKGEDVVVRSEDHKDNDYTDLVLNLKKHDGPTPVEEPDVPEGTVVAANEKGRFWGDPHFVGGDGGKFDVQGEPNKIYNILTDKNLIYHGLFIPAKDTKK